MQKDQVCPESQTYSISLLFDDEVSQKLFHIKDLFARATGNSFLIENSVPAHITLGMFHVRKDEVEKLKALFSDFAREIVDNFSNEQKWPFSIFFAATDNFKDKVIFLRPDEDSICILKNINHALHEKLAGIFKAGGNRFYLPENYFPHLGLAVKLSPGQFEKACKLKVDLPKKAEVNALSLSLCHPYCEIGRIDF